MEDVLQKDAGVLRQFVQAKMNRYLTTFVASLCLTAASGTITAAQEYVAPQVVVSTDKVRYNGKVYYSHIVQERQTLYSISKAYNVTLQEIYDANPNLHLNTEGLKKDQIILIPLKEEAFQGQGQGIYHTPCQVVRRPDIHSQKIYGLEGVHNEYQRDDIRKGQAQGQDQDSYAPGEMGERVRLRGGFRRIIDRRNFN